MMVAEQSRARRLIRRVHLPQKVVGNVFALYGVQIGRKLIPLASLPYLARVLGPEGWGQTAFVAALAELIVILIEFGFCLSATRSVARCGDDRVERGRIVVGVLGAQATLAALGIGTALIGACFIPLLYEHKALFCAGLCYALLQGFVPLWYFQGMERLRMVAGVEIVSKIIGLLGLFIFVRAPHHAWRVLALQALTPAACVTVGLNFAFSTSTLCRPRWSLLAETFRESWHMFAFRSAESLYGVANAFLLGLYAPAAVVGYFCAAEKISKAVAGLANPVRESLFPRISGLAQTNPKEAARLSSAGAMLMMTMGAPLSLGLFLFARPLILLVVGGMFQPAVDVLRVLSPLPLLLAITFSSGQLWLLPMRNDAKVLRIVISGAIANLVFSFIFVRAWGHMGMAAAVLASEGVVAISLLVAVLQSSRAFLARDAAVASTV